MVKCLIILNPLQLHHHFKKPTLDPSFLNNFRPISKLPILVKLLEKIVARQLIEHINGNGLFDEFQSGFRAGHSTESVLLRILNDILWAANNGQTSVLLLLDLTAAFHTVEHVILIEHLKHWVGISGTVLDWFDSYLSNRKFCVAIGDFKSSTSHFSYGVPQGSVFGPLLFSLYMSPLRQICLKYNFSFHFYADDSQIYFSFDSNNTTQLFKIQSCLTDVKNWLTQNF